MNDKKLACLVQEKVLGLVPCKEWRSIFSRGQSMREGCFYPSQITNTPVPHDGKRCFDADRPEEWSHHSTSMLLAWDVVNKLIPDYHMTIYCLSEYGDEWMIRFTERRQLGCLEGRREFETVQKTCPRAICVAALKIFEV